MTKEQLFKILDDNGIRYDKTVEREGTEGYVNDECAALASEIYGDLFKMATYGVNYGFSKCEDDIKELIKLIVSMITATSRKEVKIAKTDKSAFRL